MHCAKVAGLKAALRYLEDAALVCSAKWSAWCAHLANHHA